MVLFRHCGLLVVKSDCSFKMEAIKLKSVRPFVMHSVCLSDTGIHPQNNDGVESYLTEKVNGLIDGANTDCDNGKLPLVRLKVCSILCVLYIHVSK